MSNSPAGSGNQYFGTIEGYNTPTPDKVPGYNEAKSTGQLPQVPATPPSLLPGRTSFSYLIQGAASFFAGIIILCILSPILPHGTGSGFIVLPIGLFILFIGFAPIWKSFLRTLQEAKAGYTTSPISFAQVARTTKKVYRATISNSGRIPWDFNGVWYLKGNGSVKREPNHTLFAPGYYPSPNTPDFMELWTGKVWAGQFKNK